MASRFSILVVTLTIACFFTAAFSAEETIAEKEFVLTLDHSNFSDTVSKHQFIVVEFYAPWCGHCKNLAPEYEKAAQILTSNDPPIVLAKVDANEEVNKDLATQYEISGFPTIKILRNGGKTIQEYKGPREADGIVEYLKKQSGPASTEIKSAEDANSFIDEKKVVIVGVFPKFSGEEFENYKALAEKLRSDYEFGHTQNAKFLPHGESSVTGPVIRLFKPFDERFVDFKDFNVDAVEKFVEESSIPTVTVYNNDASNHPFVIKFFNSPNEKAMLFMNFSSNPESIESKYREVAENYKSQGISFLMGDLETSQGAFQYFGLKDSQVPLIIIQTNDGQKYLKPNVEADQIAPWFKEYKEGKVPAFRKSEPIPEVNNEPVKVVVADSLQDEVFNSGNNVLIEFYAPWCGHCKKLAPILEEVAVSYQDDADVVIAKFDATANDLPGDNTFDVQGYPTLYFRSASGNVLPYNGNRTKDDIIEFIDKNRDKTSAPQEPVKTEPTKSEPVKEEPPKDEL